MASCTQPELGFGALVTEPLNMGQEQGTPDMLHASCMPLLLEFWRWSFQTLKISPCLLAKPEAGPYFSPHPEPSFQPKIEKGGNEPAGRILYSLTGRTIYAYEGVLLSLYP